MLDLLGDSVELFANWGKRDEGRTLLEGYLEGRFHLIAELEAFVMGRVCHYSAVFDRTPGGIRQFDWTSRVILDGEVTDSEVIGNRRQELVLIGDGKHVQRTKWFAIPSRIRLNVPFNFLLDCRADASFKSLRNNLAYTIAGIGGWELNTLVALAAEARDGADGEVERGTKVLNCVTDDGWEMTRDRLAFSHNPSQLSGVCSVLFGNDSVWLLFDESADLRVEVRNVYFGPL